MKRYCLALDLVDDPALIREYEDHHQKVWPAVLKSIRDSGIIDLQIYRYSNRMFMIMETNDDFSFEEKNAADAANREVQDWEQLMWKYQQAMPGARPGEKWQLMQQVFKLP